MKTSPVEVDANLGQQMHDPIWEIDNAADLRCRFNQAGPRGGGPARSQ